MSGHESIQPDKSTTNNWISFADDWTVSLNAKLSATSTEHHIEYSDKRTVHTGRSIIQSNHFWTDIFADCATPYLLPFPSDQFSEFSGDNFES